MAREIITTGKSIEEAAQKAYVALGMPEEKCAIEVLEKPKKSIFGKIKVEAKIKVTVKEILKIDLNATPKIPVSEKKILEPEKAKPERVEKTNSDSQKQINNDKKLTAATEYLKEILNKMGIEKVEIKVVKKEESAIITLIGENLGILIGRHGETLDALQYLTSLVCNRVEGIYYRITLDCGNYRDKREEALQELATKISAKVRRTGRSQILEPMNPYERRIIHSVISEISGVESKSKGEEPNRRIVIIPTVRNARTMAKEAPSRESKPSYQNRNESNSTTASVPERTMEQILRGEEATAPRKLTPEQRDEKPFIPRNSGGDGTRKTLKTNTNVAGVKTLRPNTNVKTEKKDLTQTGSEDTAKFIAEKEKNTKLYGKIEL